MSDLTKHHDQAMDYAEAAEAARMRKEFELQGEMLIKALEEEMKAIDLCDKEKVPEPTYSILHRSAAALAMDCCKPRLAEQLATKGLAGGPPSEIAAELSELRSHAQTLGAAKSVRSETPRRKLKPTHSGYSGSPRIRILLADSDHDFFAKMVLLLDEIAPRRFVLEWASTYGFAVSLLRRQRFDLCLASSRIGHRSGRDLSADIMTHAVTTPVIVLGEPEEFADPASGQRVVWLDRNRLTPEFLRKAMSDSIFRGNNSTPNTFAVSDASRETGLTSRLQSWADVFKR